MLSLTLSLRPVAQLRLIRLACPAAFALALAATPAASQQPGAKLAAPHQPAFDVANYDIRLELPDTGAFISGDVTITALRAPQTHSLHLDLVHTLAVRAVTVNGTAINAERDGDAIIVPLNASTRDTVQIRVRYDGRVTDGLIVRHNAHGEWSWFADNFPDRARQWLPVVDHPDDKATVSFTVSAPSNRTVVANGVLLGVTTLGNGRSETRWREEHPIATYLMVVGASQMNSVSLGDSACVVSTVHRCVPQMAYASPENLAFLPGPFAAAPAIVSYFESLVGPFPYEKLAHLESATRFGGMENASAIFYADRLFAERSLSEGIIAHETAHQWFGDAVTESEWAHLWLSEGFATYFAALWTREAHGDAAFAHEMSVIRDKVLGDAIVAQRPVIDTEQTNYLALLNANSYEKGGYVLYMLNRELGDSAFFAGLHAYYAAHRDGNALSDDLRRALEQSSNRSLRQFFDQWLHRAGVAEATVHWAYDPASRQVTLRVSQEGKSPPYELPVTIAVTQITGEVRRVNVNFPADRRAVVALPGAYSSRPTSFVVDPDHLLLARFTTR